MKISLVKESENQLVNYVQELIAECPFEYRSQLQRYAAYEILSFTTGVSMLQEESDTHGYAEPFVGNDIVVWRAETAQKILKMFESIIIRHQKRTRVAMLN